METKYYKKRVGLKALIIFHYVTKPFFVEADPDCHCNKKCFTTVLDDEKINLLSIFNKIGDKDKHDTYLGGLIQLKHVELVEG